MDNEDVRLIAGLLNDMAVSEEVFDDALKSMSCIVALELLAAVRRPGLKPYLTPAGAALAEVMRQYVDEM